MKQHNLTLDAARGIAAMGVILYHLIRYIYPQLHFDAFPFLFQRSYLAVDLFFLMSGFVIARAYEEKLRTHHLTFRSFCITRFIRLWPLYLAGTLLGFSYHMIKLKLIHDTEESPVQNAGVAFFNALFLPAFSDKIGLYPYDPAAWSLALEWAINLIYACFAFRLATNYLLTICAVSCVLLSVETMQYGSMDMGWDMATSYGGVLRICFSFTLGIVICRLRPTHFTVPPMVLLGLLIFILVTPFGAPNVYYDMVAVYVWFPLFVWLATGTATPYNKVYTELGRLSYALYILHTPLILWILGMWKALLHMDPSQSPGISAPLLIGGIICICYGIVIYIDEPVRRKMTQRLLVRPAD